MINAEVTTGRNCFMAEIRGHAGFAPKGYDIVCAGVSALSMALLEAVTIKVKRDSAACFSVEVNDGSFEIRVLGVKDKALSAELRSMFIMLISGLERIESDYPDYLNVNLFEFPYTGNDNDTSEQTMNIQREEDKG